ncbi:MAG: hypothetical protein FJ288_14530 [Planctomycetes bacterium]|nr:hypothetical protein [Planctomycetota bacterium]
MTAAKADALRELFGRFYGSVNSLVTDEAFAACIWEIVFEDKAANGWDLEAGRLKMNGLDSNGSGNAHDIAELWLGQLTGDAGWFDYNVFALTNASYQDYALARKGFAPTPPPPEQQVPIPEPLTAGSLILGVAGLARYFLGRVAARRVP